MKKQLSYLVFFMMATLVSNTMASKTENTFAPRAVIETTLGNIILEVYPDKAPLSAKHFLNLVDQGLYNNSSFYRATRFDNWPPFEMHGKAVNILENESRLIQGGVSTWPVLGFEDDIPMVAHESTKKTGIHHTKGAISWTRGNIGTAQSEFFICIDEMPYLDHGGWPEDSHGYAAFGRVIKGMDIVEKINQQSTNDSGKNTHIFNAQGIADPIVILRIYSLSERDEKLGIYQ